MSKGLTESDLERIERFVDYPRHRRRPDMLRPDEPADADDGQSRPTTR